MSGTTSELSELGAAWLRLLQKGLQADGWGQIVEAVDSYDKYAVSVCLTTRARAVLRCVLRKQAAVMWSS